MLGASAAIAVFKVSGRCGLDLFGERFDRGSAV